MYRTHDISQQWQLSILGLLRIVPNEKNSGTKKYASNCSYGKNSSFSQLLLQEMLINIKKSHFYSSINHQDHHFHITHITSYFRPVNIAKFLRTAFLEDTSRSSLLQMFFRIGVFRSFTNFTGMYLCWSPLLKNFQAGGLQLLRKRLQHSWSFLWSLRNF